MLLANVFDSEIVDDERELHRAPRVFPETGDARALEVTLVVEALFEKLLGQNAGLGEAVHALSHFDIDKTV